jgi:hypothetical protein
MASTAWLLEIHERLLAGDPTAPAKLLQAVFLPLKRAVHERNPGLPDEHLVDDAVTEALLNYIKGPDKFNPDRAGLLGYLRMAAQGDLKNALAKRRRWQRKHTSLETVEVDVRGGKEEEAGPDIETVLEGERIHRLIAEHFTDPKDLEMAELIVAKERSTEAFAEVVGIQSLPIAEQRREVKRHKDRIKKQLKQLGKRIRDEEL